MNFHLHLDTETIEHIRFDSPLWTEPTMPVREVVKAMRAHQRGSVLVGHNDRLQGIFTERDALRMMAGGVTFDLPVSDVMTCEPVTISLQETVGIAIQRMSQGAYRRLPIVDEQGKPVGILKVMHILHYLVEHFPQVIYTLPPTPHHTTQSREGA